jgi:hypothetical protein
VAEQSGLILHISEKLEGGFAVLPKCWVVERTFAWLGAFRRLSTASEILTATAENMTRQVDNGVEMLIRGPFSQSLQYEHFDRASFG